MFFSRNTPQWLLVFLGNPGDRYRDTRHNVGFQSAHILAERHRIPIKRLKYKALTGVGAVSGHRVMLMLPQTYMNLSGQAVRPAAAFYKIPPERIVVVADDVSLAPGRLRVRRKGSAGGHNGLKSIIAELGCDAFPRVKIGVGAPPHPDFDMADWVLGRPRGQELEAVQAAVTQAADAVEALITAGVDAAMNRYNA